MSLAGLSWGAGKHLPCLLCWVGAGQHCYTVVRKSPVSGTIYLSKDKLQLEAPPGEPSLDWVSPCGAGAGVGGTGCKQGPSGLPHPTLGLPNLG